MSFTETFQVGAMINLNPGYGKTSAHNAVSNRLRSAAAAVSESMSGLVLSVASLWKSFVYDIASNQGFLQNITSVRDLPDEQNRKRFC